MASSSRLWGSSWQEPGLVLRILELEQSGWMQGTPSPQTQNSDEQSLGRWVRGTGGTFHLARSWVICHPESARECLFSSLWLTSIYHFLFLGDLWQDPLFEIVWPKDFKRSTSCVGYFIKGPFFSTCGAQLGGGILLQKPALKYPCNT